MPSVTGGKGKAGRTSPAKTAATTTTKAKTPAKPAAVAKPVKAAAAVTKPAAKKAPAPAKAASAAKPKRKALPKIDPDQRQHYIEVAAYYIAERRGFLGGCDVEDWAQAEREIDELLREGRLSV